MFRALILLISIVCCSNLLAADSALVKRWEFHSANDAAGWTIGNQLTDLHVADGRLRMTLAGQDAFVFAPPVDVPLDGCVVRLRMRCDHAGVTQIFWQTKDRPQYDEQHTLNEATRASDGLNDLLTVEFPIGTMADADKTLTAFRIDPYNNNSNTGVVEIESVELLRLPPVFDANFALGSHHVDVEQNVSPQVMLKQIGGRKNRETFTARLRDGNHPPATFAPTTQPVVLSELRFDRPGVNNVHVSLQPPSGLPKYNMDTSIIVGDGERLPLVPALRTDRVRLDLIPVEGDTKKVIGAARWQIADRQGQWHQCGWLLPLVELTIGAYDGSAARVHPSLTMLEYDQRSIRLKVQMYDNWNVEVGMKVVEVNGLQAIAVTSTLSGPEGGRLLGFSLPVLRADRERTGDPLNRFGLFGGLEFLEPGWRSSSDRAVGDQFADRWSPHPFKVTLPVMAVEAAGVTSAMMWQPTDKWDTEHAQPTATFASPNFLDGQNNHLMKLSAPSIPAWMRENEPFARNAYVMHKGQPITLRCVLYGDAELPVAMTARRWYELFGPPEPPPLPHDDRATHNLIARNFGETMYWAKDKGWRGHWYLAQPSGYHNFMAGTLIAHALETGDRQWIDRTGLSRRTVIDAVGPLAPRLDDSGSAKAQLNSMRPDGTWTFTNTEQMRKQARETTKGKYDSLGEDGSTSLGTCVQQALPILRYAELSGNDICIAGSIKALEAMRRFRVPRGAQVWEVHQMIPDIRAAALAVEAYTIGYHITGDSRWLDDASYWAWAGVPFLYSWHVPIEQIPGRVAASRDRDVTAREALPFGEAFENPHRQVTPFGSVPVLGPTFYVINWFGVIVQWCGMEWAQHVIELDRDRPDPLLRWIADGVVASGRQQMFDRPPWFGLFPDVWDIQSNQALGAFISAMLPMECLQAQGRATTWSQPWTRVIRDGKRQWHVSGWGTPVKLPPPIHAGPWSATIAFFASQPNELIIAGAKPPHRVRAGDSILKTLSGAPPPASDLSQTGWWYNADKGAVIVHFTQDESRMQIHIDW